MNELIILESLFWKVAEKRSEDDDTRKLTLEQKEQAGPLIDKLKKLEAERVKCFDQLREIYGYYCWDYLEDDIFALEGFKSSKDYLSHEEFSADEVAELNSQGILTWTQHTVAAGSKNPYHIPFEADRIMSRREMSKAMGVSNDKITNLIDKGLPVLSKGANGQSDKYSAIAVYRWLLDAEYTRRSNRQNTRSLLTHWKDGQNLGDIGNGTFSKNPTTQILNAYKKAQPDLF